MEAQTASTTGFITQTEDFKEKCCLIQIKHLDISNFIL
jgi:hypothetical protein